jgi:general secretion pathway protein A
MYTTFFGLKENPFNLTPDPRYLFLSPYHKEALDHLLYGINERKGFITITGGIGTGKTTLCRALLSHLDKSSKSALIFNAFISDVELLRTVNQEFGIDDGSAVETKKGYVDALNHFLLETFSHGGNAVLLIDEAQNLSQPVLEQIRMLSNLETEKEKLIQIVLVGQSELKELLAAPSLRQLDERIMVRYDLKPIDSRDMQGYVEHRLVVAGGRGDLRFTSGAFKKIYTYSQGNPRRINAVCDRALLIAYTKEKYTIPKEIIDEAIKALHGDISIEPYLRGWSWKRIVSVTALLLLLIMVAGFAGWSFREDVTRIFSGEQKTAIVQKRETLPKKRVAPLFLNEQTSLSGLFTLFNKVTGDKNYHIDNVNLSLVSFTMEPEYYIMFKKPFRIHLSDSLSPAFPRYLLIREVTKQGAVAMDARGKERTITRDFILKHWDQRISFVYPPEYKNVNMVKGMEGPDVLKVQKMLNEIGYLIKPSGIFDGSMAHEVFRFQKDFNLLADGIVGPRTKALLFQMTE